MLRRVPRFRFEVVCKSGVLITGSLADFLSTVVAARHAKREWKPRLPHSTLRVRLYYPNGNRVTKADVRAAVAAIDALEAK